MIYTIGHEKSYLEAIERCKPEPLIKLGRRDPGDKFPQGYSGGYAFKTRALAQARIDEQYSDAGFVVFGLDAKWGIDTGPALDGWWHSLLNDSEVLRLSDHAD